jgi:hypothetical protein
MVIVLAHLYLRLWCARWILVGAQITYSTQQHRTEQKIQILIFDSIVIFMISLIPLERWNSILYRYEIDPARQSDDASQYTNE